MQRRPVGRGDAHRRGMKRELRGRDALDVPFRLCYNAREGAVLRLRVMGAAKFFVFSGSRQMP